MMGTPNEQIWPGVSQLPDFGMKFPCWKPQPLPSAIARYPDKELTDLFMVNVKKNAKYFQNIHSLLSFDSK